MRTSEERPQRRTLLSLFAFAAFALLVTLGVWQLNRLAWKRDLLARIEALNSAPGLPLGTALERANAGQDVEYLRVVADCPGLDQAPYLKLFTIQERVTGFRAVSVCRVADGPYGSVLVDRGFVADADAARLPGPDLKAAEHRAVVGLLHAPSPPTFVTPRNRPAENRWFSRDVEAMAQALGARSPAPLFLMLESPPPQGFGPIPSPLPVQISNRHLGYAITWFGLALALAGVYVAFLIRNRRQG
jgi:surfeit locus 1 family protein